jgi:hypothetical protein
MIDAAKELICEDVDDIVKYNSHNDFISAGLKGWSAKTPCASGKM